MHLISVVLGSGWYPNKNQKWVDTKAIMNYGFRSFKPQEIIRKGQRAGIVQVLHGTLEKVEVGYAEKFSLPLKEDDKIRTQVDIPISLEAPITKGTVLGYGEVFINEEKYARIPLQALYTVERHDFFTSLQKIINHWMQFIHE